MLLKIIGLPLLIAATLSVALPSFAHADDGSFYRRSIAPQVYFLTENEICRVVGPGQLDALGGTGRVQVVGPAAELGGGRTDRGACPWPTGFYRYPDKPQVYYINEYDICRVVGEGQMRALGGRRAQVVGANADLAHDKTDGGACRWP